MPPSQTRTVFLCILLGLNAHLAAQSPLPKASPFSGPPSGTARVVPEEVIEFAGVSSIGAKTDLILYDRAARKSRWIPLGETVDGISALSYDANREEAVVSLNGTRKILPLRKARTVQGAAVPPVLPPGPALAITAQPAITPVPDAPAGLTVLPDPAALTVLPDAGPAGPLPEAAAAAAANPAKSEAEARMLVSDLLEIGIAQRKAYEEAQRKAAGEVNSGPNATASAIPPTPDAGSAPPRQN